MSEIPGWLQALGSVVDIGRPGRVPDGVTARPAAVLVLFTGGSGSTLPDDADVLLTERASSLRQHGGQIAFPGGAVDPGDDGPVHTALREAQEETGLDPAVVHPLATLEPIYVPPSGFEVTPVLAFSSRPGPLRVMDPGETARVVRVRLRSLLDPAHRFVVEHRLGYRSPAFEVEGMLVWGFTAGILAGLFDAVGWAQEWDVEDVRDFEAAAAAVARTQGTRVQ